MKTIAELNLGFSDAQNYSLKDNKSMFNNVFVKNTFLDDIIKPNNYFLIGEKGTGKTAYSVYLSNNQYKENKSLLTFISATDYDKFYNLKKEKQLTLTDYEGIWKVILLLLISSNISEKDIITSMLGKNPLKSLLKAINDYYLNAFNPEVITALKIIDHSKLAAELICKYSKIEGANETQLEFTESRFQMNLYYIERNFAEALKRTKLNKNINLFIDGIDIRPDNIPYQDYIECIRGLVNAFWNLNTTLFANIKDSKGRLKIVLLLRPDIFSALNLQNTTNKLRDNSVFLDWRTTYQNYENSYLYKVSENILSFQNPKIPNNIWDQYFPWKLTSTTSNREFDTAFIEFLRISLSRPRDFIVIMQLLQDLMKQEMKGHYTYFLEQTYKSNQFQNMYSEYFISSLKDQLSFYYSVNDFKYFIHFFTLFKKEDFTYQEYKKNYDLLIQHIKQENKENPSYFDNETTFLQLLYNSNIIMAIENTDTDKYFKFSYREKSLTNISPQVPIDANISYRFHYGLYKKAKFGRF